jgi:hypothetical protein
MFAIYFRYGVGDVGGNNDERKIGCGCLRVGPRYLNNNRHYCVVPGKTFEQWQ